MNRKQYNTYEHSPQAPVGILLANTGSPDKPTPAAVKVFLREFLADPRVIDLPRWLWMPILNHIILNVRPKRSARLYQRIWSQNGSPLLFTAQKQAEQLHLELSSKFETPIEILAGMRYGNPSIASGLQTLKSRGVERFLIVPLFPQFSNTTTASIMDAVYAETKTWENSYQIRSIPQYYDHAAYIKALSNSVTEYWKIHAKSERLLISFHGIPQRYTASGDPYGEQCRKTSALLADALGLESNTWQVAFQSRFGPQKWLQPYTDRTLKNWGEQGIKEVDVICPGFSTDCLETLQEIQIEAKESFLGAGGAKLNYIPALNDHADHIRALAAIIQPHIYDWIEPTSSGERSNNAVVTIEHESKHS